MKNVYRMIHTLHHDSNFCRQLIISVSCICCIFTAFYANWYLQADIVYTHFFYIPIILTGIWYGREALYVAMCMGVFHIIMNYSIFGAITFSSIQRALVFMVIALILYGFTNFMKNSDKMLYTLHRYSDLCKKLIILVCCVLCIAAAFYVNLYLKADIVYSHFFYIPIILSGIWYGKFCVYLAAYLGIFHICINYSVFNEITASSLQRALLFVVIALIVYVLTNFRYDKLNQSTHPTSVSEKDHPVHSRLQQIEMVGQVGVAVGHEIRNPLTTVRGFLQMLGSEENYEGAREYFSLMIEELDKADATIGHLINLANNKTNNPKNLNLNLVIHECLSQYLSPETLSNITIETRLNDIPDILIDKLEVRELIENLLINAIEAMPGGGTIIVSTYTFENEVLLTIQDQGTGISAEAAKCIGTPFFTTKETSAGLGLAICYSIARRHSAQIEFVSTPKGTKFIVYFPTGIPESTKVDMVI